MGATQSPWLYSETGHPFDRMPLTLVGQIDNDGAGGIQYYFNHFFEWVGPTSDQAAPGTGGWIVTSVDGGTDAGESVDIRDSARYGILRIVTNDADNDNTQIQMNGSGWRYSSGQRMWYFTRIALQDADDGECAFGLCIETDTEVIGGVSDAIYFEKAETATDFDFHVTKDSGSTENTADLGLTLDDDTFVVVGFTVNQAGTVQPHSIAAGGAATDGTAILTSDTNIVDNEDLTPFYQIQTGAAATRYMDIDWLLVAAEHA